MNQEAGDTSVMSVKDWLITWIIMLIPCVGLIMGIVWAFSNKGNLNRKNYCRAYLIIVAAIVVLYIIAFIIFGAALFAIFDVF